MTIIEPVKQNPLKPSETRQYSFSIRTWHWLNVLVISGSLITVLINSTLLDKKSTIELITAQAAKAGGAIDSQTSQQIAHELGDRVWNVHGYIGLVLAALLLYRIIYELVGPASQSLFKKISIARTGLKHGGEEKYLAQHDFVVKLIYAGFYLVLLVMAVTGTMLFFKHQLALEKSVAHQIQELHGTCMYIVILFVLVHLTGVILAERKQSPGIISNMINGGGKNKPA